VEDVGRRRLAWLAVLLYAGLIFALSSRTAAELPPGPFPHVDKLVHFVEYAVLGALVAVALGGRLSAGWIAVALVLCAGYGASDEWHQRFVPGRDASIFDLVADTLGAAAGILAVARPWRPEE
jgi:VanZ family protein